MCLKKGRYDRQFEDVEKKNLYEHKTDYDDDHHRKGQFRHAIIALLFDNHSESKPVSIRTEPISPRAVFFFHPTSPRIPSEWKGVNQRHIALFEPSWLVINLTWQVNLYITSIDARDHPEFCFNQNVCEKRKTTTTRRIREDLFKYSRDCFNRRDNTISSFRVLIYTHYNTVIVSCDCNTHYDDVM